MVIKSPRLRAFRYNEKALEYILQHEGNQSQQDDPAVTDAVGEKNLISA